MTSSRQEHPVSCQDVVFERGACRVEIVEVNWPLGGSRFVARISTVLPDGRTEPLITEAHAPAEVHAESEPLALSTALALLEERLGALSLYPADCAVDKDRTA